jgi:undecaprenyl-diphosphatase
MDSYLSETFNAVVGRSPAFDLLLDFVQKSYLLKGLFATGILVALYAARDGDARARRCNVYATLILVFAGLFAARVMQMTLPFSPRPLYAEGMELALIAGLDPGALRDDSSFPSDHAVMFLTIAASVLLYARRTGMVLLAHALIVICLPRVVIGFHWASDIAAGAAIGLVLALGLQRPLARWLDRSPIEEFRARHGPLFHFLLFAVLCETAKLYSGSRHLLSTAAEAAAVLF